MYRDLHDLLTNKLLWLFLGFSFQMGRVAVHPGVLVIHNIWCFRMLKHVNSLILKVFQVSLSKSQLLIRYNRLLLATTGVWWGIIYIQELSFRPRICPFTRGLLARHVSGWKTNPNLLCPFSIASNSQMRSNVSIATDNGLYSGVWGHWGDAFNAIFWYSNFVNTYSDLTEKQISIANLWSRRCTGGL